MATSCGRQPTFSASLGTISMQYLRRAVAGAARALVSRPSAEWRVGRWAGPSASLTTSHNPFDFDSAGHKDRLLARLETAVEEADEPLRLAEQAREECKAAALKLLGVRPHSSKELKAKLLERGHTPDVVRCVLQRLQEVGLQSDTEFADVFVRSKWRQSQWGPSKLRAELSRRGVAPEEAAAALRSVFGEGLDLGRHLEDLADLEHTASSSGSSGSSASSSAAGLAASAVGSAAPLHTHGRPAVGLAPEARLLAQTRRQYALSAGLPSEVRRRRLVGWLQRRGHRWDDISRLLHQLEKEEASATIDSAPSLDGEE